MITRLETPEDYREVEELTRKAFWNVYRPGCVEHFVLHHYRSNPDFIPELDFVLEEDGKIIGHVMYSRAELTSDEGDVLPAWTLGPISIHPDWKRKGYGLALLKFSLGKAREMGIGVLCFEGNIEFYGNAGFVFASSLGIHYHAEPKDDPVPYFLAQELVSGYLGGREWMYCPPKGYFAANDDPEGFENYEATFPAKEKHFQKGQLPQFCQSCGMPMTSDDVCGTNADGSSNFDYCKYCYQDGEFIDTPYWPKNDVKPAFLFCCFSGLRHSDLLKLTWGEIKQTADGQYQIETMMKKTKHSVSVPLSENALSFLPERGESKDSDRVFPNLPDQPGNADARLKTLIRHAGIDKKVSFHVGRHTFATLTLTYGADLYTVSKLLGHCNIRTTQIYAKIVDEQKRKAVNLIPKI